MRSVNFLMLFILSVVNVGSPGPLLKKMPSHSESSNIKHYGYNILHAMIGQVHYQG